MGKPKDAYGEVDFLDGDDDQQESPVNVNTMRKTRRRRRRIGLGGINVDSVETAGRGGESEDCDDGDDGDDGEEFSEGDDDDVDDETYSPKESACEDGCGRCGKPFGSGVLVLCDGCWLWHHHRCAGFTKEEAESGSGATGVEWRCAKCDPGRTTARKRSPRAKKQRKEKAEGTPLKRARLKPEAKKDPTSAKSTPAKRRAATPKQSAERRQRQPPTSAPAALNKARRKATAAPAIAASTGQVRGKNEDTYAAVEAAASPVPPWIRLNQEDATFAAADGTVEMPLGEMLGLLLASARSLVPYRFQAIPKHLVKPGSSYVYRFFNYRCTINASHWTDDGFSADVGSAVTREHRLGGVGKAAVVATETVEDGKNSSGRVLKRKSVWTTLDSCLVAVHYFGQDDDDDDDDDEVVMLEECKGTRKTSAPPPEVVDLDSDDEAGDDVIVEKTHDVVKAKADSSTPPPPAGSPRRRRQLPPGITCTRVSSSSGGQETVRPNPPSAASSTQPAPTDDDPSSSSAQHSFVCPGQQGRATARKKISPRRTPPAGWPLRQWHCLLENPPPSPSSSSPAGPQITSTYSLRHVSSKEQNDVDKEY